VKLDKILMLGLCLMIPGLGYAEHEEITGKAALGGGLGGAAGGAIGAEIGGREGAILGSAAGAALGATLSTSGSSAESHPKYGYGPRYSEPKHHHHYGFCPPGQAKKGRC
jgi:hypothetical protein